MNINISRFSNDEGSLIPNTLNYTRHEQKRKENVEIGNIGVSKKKHKLMDFLNIALYLIWQHIYLKCASFRNESLACWQLETEMEQEGKTKSNTK